MEGSNVSVKKVWEDAGWGKVETLLAELNYVSRSRGPGFTDAETKFFRYKPRPRDEGGILLACRSKSVITLLLDLGNQPGGVLYERHVDELSLGCADVSILVDSKIVLLFRMERVLPGVVKRKIAVEPFRVPKNNRTLLQRFGADRLFARTSFLLDPNAPGGSILPNNLKVEVVWDLLGDEPVHIYEPESTTWGLPFVLDALIKNRLLKCTTLEAKKLAEKAYSDGGADKKMIKTVGDTIELVCKQQPPKRRFLFADTKKMPLIFSGCPPPVSVVDGGILILVGHGDQTGNVSGLQSGDIANFTRMYECVVLLVCHGRVAVEKSVNCPNLITISTYDVVEPVANDPLVEFATYCASIAYGECHQPPGIQNLPLRDWLYTLFEKRVVQISKQRGFMLLKKLSDPVFEINKMEQGGGNDRMEFDHENVVKLNCELIGQKLKQISNGDSPLPYLRLLKTMLIRFCVVFPEDQQFEQVEYEIIFLDANKTILIERIQLYQTVLDKLREWQLSKKKQCTLEQFLDKDRHLIRKVSKALEESGAKLWSNYVQEGCSSVYIESFLNLNGFLANLKHTFPAIAHDYMWDFKQIPRREKPFDQGDCTKFDTRESNYELYVPRRDLEDLGDTGSGSLGFLCGFSDGKYAVTVAHVVFGKLTDMSYDNASRLLRMVSFAVYEPQIDAAALPVVDDMRVCDVSTCTCLSKFKIHASEWDEMFDENGNVDVWMCGKNSGRVKSKLNRTKGRIDTMHYKNVFAVPNFSSGGDSGSLWLADPGGDMSYFVPIAIHRGGDNVYSYGVPLDSVYRRLFVERMHLCMKCFVFKGLDFLVPLSPSVSQTLLDDSDIKRYFCDVHKKHGSHST